MDAQGKPSVTLLRGDPIYGEASATATIRPGQLLVTQGGARTVSNNPTATPAPAGAVAPIFARENEVVGDGLADAYASGDNVLLMHNRRGDWVYAWLAAGQNIAAGANLSAVGAGNLGAATPGSQAGVEPFAAVFPSVVIARALEAVNNTAGADPVRIKVEIV